MVKNGKFTSINNINFDIPYVSAGGSWGNLTLSHYVADKSAGVTANYKITKKIFAPIEDISVPVISETKGDLFALLSAYYTN